MVPECSPQLPSQEMSGKGSRECLLLRVQFQDKELRRSQGTRIKLCEGNQLKKTPPAESYHEDSEQFQETGEVKAWLKTQKRINMKKWK